MSESDNDYEDYAQNLLERAKLRAQLLTPNQKLSSSPPKKAVIEKLLISEEKQEMRVTFDVSNSEMSDDEGESEKSSGEENRIPSSVEGPEYNDDDDSGGKFVDGVPGTPVGQRKPLKRLGELYSGAMLWSPAHDHTEGERPPEPVPTKNDVKTIERRSRFDALAKKINERQDDYTHHTLPGSRFNISPLKNSKSSPFTTPVSSNSNTVRNSLSFADTAGGFKQIKTKTLKTNPNSALATAASIHVSPPSTLDDTVLKVLEAQGFQVRGRRSMSSSPTRKPAPASSPVKSVGGMDLSSPTRKPVASPVRNVGGMDSSSPDRSPRPSSVVQKTTVSNSKITSLLEKDPAELTVAERARLFEMGAVGQVAPVPMPMPSRPQVVPQKTLVKSFKAQPQHHISNKHEASFAAFQPGKVENQRRLFEGNQKLGSVAEFRRSPKHQPAHVPVTSKPPLPNTQIPMDVDMESSNDAQVSFSALTEDSPSPSRSMRRRSRSISPLKETSKPRQSTTPKRAASPSLHVARSRSNSPSKKDYPGSRDVKRIRVNEPKPGKIYPSLTDIESTETETEVEHEEMDQKDTTHSSGISQASSLGTQIERMAKGNEVLPTQSQSSSCVTPKRHHRYRPTEDFSTSLACREIDALIDDALEGQDFSLEMDTINEEIGIAIVASSTPINSGEKEDSISFRKENSSRDTVVNESSTSSSTLKDIQQVTTVIEHPVEDTNPQEQKDATEDTNQDASPLESSSPLYAKRRYPSPPKQEAQETPLMRSVSMFRKQQEQMSTPRRMVRNEEQHKLPPSPERRKARIEAVNESVKKLEIELGTQLKSISEVSKALNLCKSTVEFSESTENVECERVLLIATHKHKGILDEIHRLKTNGVLTSLAGISPSKHDLGPSCLGRMSVSDIEVDLKRNFLPKAMEGDIVYHFIALLKSRAQVEASALVSVGNGVSSSRIQDGRIHFPNTFTLADLDPDFEAKLEVYLLQTHREFLPHEAKYHIKKQKEKGLTPKKLKGDSKLSRAFQQSPAGPDAVRSPNFAICGSLSIDISTLSRMHWNLDGVRPGNPVEGSVALKIACSAQGSEEKDGWLTLFFDVSGLGSWNRRWAKLTSNHMKFWMYPEDAEEGKNPIDQIALRHCVTTRVCPVSRDVCARMNTLLLMTTRQPLPTDKDSLVTSCHSDYTAIRHLIAADSREERDEWCGILNRALANLRAWDPQAQSPDDTLF